jgi:hypothetical protein
MPFNGSGTFAPDSAYNPVEAGTLISSTAFNATMEDIATGLSNCVTRDGQGNAAVTESNTLLLFGSGAVDTAKVTSSSAGVGLSFSGRASDNYSAIRFLLNNGSAELSRIVAQADGSLTFLHGGAQSATFSAAGSAFAQPVTINASSAAGLNVTNSSIDRTTIELNNTTSRAWLLGVSGSAAGVAPAGALFAYDASVNLLRAYWDAAGVLHTLAGQQVSGGVLTVSNDAGGNYGGEVQLINAASGAASPTKTLRINPTGGLEIINNAFTASIWTLSDGGNSAQAGGASFGGSVSGAGASFTGAVSAGAFAVTSSAALKDVQGSLSGEAAFARVMQWLPRLYTLKADGRARVRAGLVVEEAPPEITDGNGCIDLYAALTELGAAFQFLARKLGGVP